MLRSCRQSEQAAVAVVGRRATTSLDSDSVVLGVDSPSDRDGARGANPRRSLGAPSRATGMLAGLKSQAHRRETTGDIETGAAFDADWLQRDRIVGAADQHIGADPYPDRNACGCASISAG
jgi:hypothetical protein